MNRDHDDGQVIRVRFHGSLYPVESVQDAAAALAHLARISVAVEGADVVVRASDVAPPARARFADHLANRALVHAAQARRGTVAGGSAA